MPLGNYTSQFFANVYLNKLDYFIKHTLRVKYYLRYVDDFVILDKNRERLERYKKYVNEYLHNLGLKLHPTKSRIMPLHQGAPLLGFRVFYHFKLLKESGIRQIQRNLKIWRRHYLDGTDYDSIASRLQGWMAHAEHGSTYNFRKKIAREFNNLFFSPPKKNSSTLGGRIKIKTTLKILQIINKRAPPCREPGNLTQNFLKIRNRLDVSDYGFIDNPFAIFTNQELMKVSPHLKVCSETFSDFFCFCLLEKFLV